MTTHDNTMASRMTHDDTLARRQFKQSSNHLKTKKNLQHFFSRQGALVRFIQAWKEIKKET